VFEAFARRDVDAVVDLLDPEVEFHGPTARIANRGLPYVGVEGIRKYFADVGATWHELRLIQHEYTEMGERVVVRGRVWARQQSGGILDSPAWWVWRFRGDAIVRIEVARSAEEARQALGT
jgi:ketosteroid isomerase-like protein